MNLNRRSLLKLSAATAAVGSLGLPSFAQAIDELVIAYNVNLPSWDPTVGPSAVNPTLQGLYQSVFDQYILQQPDLSPAPGLLTEWGWNEDKTQVWMTVREGVTWHDGSPFTPEDVAWNLNRVLTPETGSSVLRLMQGYMMHEDATPPSIGQPVKSSRVTRPASRLKVDGSGNGVARSTPSTSWSSLKARVKYAMPATEVPLTLPLVRLWPGAKVSQVTPASYGLACTQPTYASICVLHFTPRSWLSVLPSVPQVRLANAQEM